MSRLDFFSRLSRFARTMRQNTLSRRITHAYGLISQTCQKNLSKIENIFWWLKKLFLPLPHGIFKGNILFQGLLP